MADTNTRIIIDVSLNSEDASAKAKDLGTSIKAIKEEQKQLKASNEETSVSYQSNAMQLRQLQAEQKAYINISQSAEGSNNQLRAQLSLLTQQYNALGKEERDNTIAGKALQSQMKGISDELKVNESAVGDNRRNVGNYKDALGSATDEMSKQKEELTSLTSITERAPIGFKLFADQVTNVKNQLQNFKQASDEAKAAQEDATLMRQIATQAVEKETQATEALTAIGFRFAAGEATIAEVELVRTAATEASTAATAAQTLATEAQTAATAAGTNAAKVFKVALASTGIGAIIILVAALASYLSSYDPLIDKVEQAFAGLKAGFDVIGRVIVGFITNIKSVGDLFSKLGGFLKDPIGSFKSLGKEMLDAAVAAAKLKEAQQDLNDQLAIQEIRNAKAEQQIKKLTLESKNRALSEEERQKKAKEAQDLDAKNFNERDKLVNQELSQAIEASKIKGKLNETEIGYLKKKGTEYAYNLLNAGKITDAEVELISSAELKKIKILDESTSRQEKLQNIQDALADKAAQMEEKRQAKLKAAAEKASDADQERLESIMRINESILTARQNEIASINFEIDEKISKYRKYGATTEQLEKERIARLKQANEEFNKKNKEDVIANQREIEDLLISSVRDSGDRELMQIAANNQRKIQEQDDLIAMTKERIRLGEEGLTELLLSQQNLRNGLIASNQDALDQKSEEIRIEKMNKESEIFTQQLEKEQAFADAKQNIRDQEAKNIEAGIGLLEQIFDKSTAIGKAAFIAEKAFAVARIIINTQAALAANRLAEQIQNVSLSAIPFYGIVLAATNSAKAQAERTRIVISGAISAGAVLATAVSGFSTGGVFTSDGKGAVLPGYSKTDNTNAVLRSGEAVIVSEAARDPKALAALSAINVAYGGNPLAPGYAMASGGISQGGFVTEISNSVGGTLDMVNLIVTAIKSTPPPIVDVRTITTAQQTNQIAISNANL